MPKIVYLENPENLLRKLNLSDDKVCELLKAKDCFDFAGGIFLPKVVFEENLNSFPSDISEFLISLGNQKEENVHLRAKKYYLNLVYQDDINIIRDILPEHSSKTADHICKLSGLERICELEPKLMIASILDHKKHYSMCMLNAFFYHMLNHSLDINLYNSVKEGCIKDINNFYRFLITGELAEQSQFKDDIFKMFREEIIFPLPTLPAQDSFKEESTARKIIIREMDHPMQMLLFAGQIINQNIPGIIDFIINPLSGALEIGYAIKSVYATLGVDKVKDILLVKYSHYGERDGISSSLEPFIPQQIKEELNKIRGTNVCIIDDNVFTGETLDNLRKMCYYYTTRVGIAAIEKRTDIPTESIIEFEDLNIKPISKLRYIGRVIKYIEDNNLYKKT